MITLLTVLVPFSTSLILSLFHFSVSQQPYFFLLNSELIPVTCSLEMMLQNSPAFMI